MNSSSHAKATCRICAQSSSFIFKQLVLGNAVSYYQCDNCGYAQTETPYWLEKAYEDAINLSDCGIVKRNERTRQLLIVTLARLGLLKGKILDCAGGYGLLVRMLRDWGVDAYWHDPYCHNLVARGFELDNVSDKFDAVTAFEVLEHMGNPVEEIKELFTYADTLICSTALISTPAPAPRTWWYYAFEHGQHIGFFTKPALQILADKLGVYLATDGKSFHVLSKEKTISNGQLRILKEFKFLASVISKFSLKSKIWDDHHQLSSKHHDE